MVEGVAVDGAFGEGDVLFGLVEVRPRFFVGAFAAHRQGFRAVDAEQVEAVDEDAALQVERFAQVEFEGFSLRRSQ